MKQKNTRKIIFFLPHERPGGAEKITKQLFDFAVLESSLDPILVILDSNVGPSYDHDHNKKVYRLKSKRLRNSIGKIVSILMKERPDICFSSFGYISIFLTIVCALTGFRLIVRESNTLGKKWNEFSMFQKVIYLFSYRYLYRFCDVIITQSQVMTHDLKNFLSPSMVSKMIEIPNFIVPKDIIKLDLLERDRKIESWRLVSVGRLVYQKGFEILLESLSLLPPTLDWSMDIYGEGENLTSLKSMAKRLKIADRVQFLGNVSPLNTQLLKYHYLIVSSHYEGFSNVVLESLSIGLPVIINKNVGGAVEAIEEGVNGHFFCDLKNELYDLLQQPYKFDHSQIKQKAEQKFSSGRILPLYLRIFLKINSHN